MNATNATWHSREDVPRLSRTPKVVTHADNAVMSSAIRSPCRIGSKRRSRGPVDGVRDDLPGRRFWVRLTTGHQRVVDRLELWIPGVAWSDRWSFWQHGYPAIMLTDTAPYRYPHYHLHTDTPERLDYERMAQVVTGCAAAIHARGRDDPPSSLRARWPAILTQRRSGGAPHR